MLGAKHRRRKRGTHDGPASRTVGGEPTNKGGTPKGGAQGGGTHKGGARWWGTGGANDGLASETVGGRSGPLPPFRPPMACGGPLLVGKQGSLLGCLGTVWWKLGGCYLGRVVLALVPGVFWVGVRLREGEGEVRE